MFRKIFFIAILLSFFTLSVDGQVKGKKADLQRQRQETTKKLKESSRQFELNKAETKKTINQLARVEEEIKQLKIQIATEQAKVDSLDYEIKAISDTIDIINNKLQNLSEKYASALRHQQGHSMATSELAFVFASDNFSQAWRRYRSLRQFAKWRSLKAKEINEMKNRLVQRQIDLLSMKQSREEKIKKLDSQTKTLKESKVLNDKLIASLKKKGTEIKAVMDQRQKELKQLDRELERLIAEEQARIERERKLAEERRKAMEAESIRIAQQKKEKSKEKNSVSEVQQQSSPSIASSKPESLTSRNSSQLNSGFLSAKGKLPYPVDGKHMVIRHFGRQKHPSLPMIEIDNPGIDILVNEGEPVRAVYEGVVSAIFKQPGYNTIVMIRHGNYLSIYANLESINVRRDQRIAPGQQIGKVAVDEDDEQGRAVLHFEIRNEKEKENPETWLKR